MTATLPPPVHGGDRKLPSSGEENCFSSPSPLLPFPFPLPSLPPFFYLACFLSFSSPPPLVYHFLPCPSFPTISFPRSLLRIGVCGQKVRFVIPKGMCVSLVFAYIPPPTPFQNPIQEKPHLKSRYIWFSLLSSGCPTHLFFKQYSRFSRSLAHAGFPGAQLNTLVGT